MNRRLAWIALLVACPVWAQSTIVPAGPILGTQRTPMAPVTTTDARTGETTTTYGSPQNVRYTLYRIAGSGDPPIHRDSIVKVEAVERERLLSNGYRGRGSDFGTGGVIYSDSDNTLVVSNAHVTITTNERDHVLVHCGQQRCRAKVLWENPNYHQDGLDVAFLWIQTPKTGELPALPLADVPANTPVYSAGFAHGKNFRSHSGRTQGNWGTPPGSTVASTHGIVSGESGSPLVDQHGRMVAVLNSSDHTSIAFGIPASKVCEALQNCSIGEPVNSMVNAVRTQYGCTTCPPASGGIVLSRPIPRQTCPPGVVCPTPQPGRPGAPGKDGKDGRGIASMTIQDGILLVRYTDGQTEAVGQMPAGPAGQRGPMGPQGPQGEAGQDASPGDSEKLIREVLARVPKTQLRVTDWTGKETISNEDENGVLKMRMNKPK